MSSSFQVSLFFLKRQNVCGPCFSYPFCHPTNKLSYKKNSSALTVSFTNRELDNSFPRIKFLFIMQEVESLCFFFSSCRCWRWSKNCFQRLFRLVFISCPNLLPRDMYFPKPDKKNVILKRDGASGTPLSSVSSTVSHKRMSLFFVCCSWRRSCFPRFFSVFFLCLVWKETEQEECVLCLSCLI